MSEETRTLVLGGGTRGTVTRCRDFTRSALDDWGWTAGAAGTEHPYDPERQEAAEDVLLLVSELVGNACIHAGGPRELVLRHGPGRLRMEVGDGSPEHPRRLEAAAAPARPGGNGLLILDRLARSWGWEPYADGRTGKTVWAEVPVPGSAPEPDPDLLRAPAAHRPEGSTSARSASG
ncbi:ATP-binding protein [Streptomyces sp. NPDC097981]|uniref:ATP-binding protein n=1 Tax=Streptomyces sp. NPDC097981 TaxID=3155428 RepID=UPI0033206450